MAAPNGTHWGSVRGSGTKQGRIGIYYSYSDTATTRTINIGIWFWTRYRCSDGQNLFKYGWGTTANTSIGSKNINTPSNTSWSTDNQVYIAKYSKTYTFGTSNTTRYVTASYENVEYGGGSGSISVPFTIPSKVSYKITYNANGGTGAPSTQTKWQGQAAIISTTKPTKPGAVFRGWALSPTGGLAYRPGDEYHGDMDLNLYALWTENSYTITYNANGGTGAPSTQTKQPGVAIRISSTVPTRTDYKFLGWSTSAGGTVMYSPGDTYSANASIVLYAIWAIGYIKPRIWSVKAERYNNAGTIPQDNGTTLVAEFNWETDTTIKEIGILSEPEGDPNNAVYEPVTGISGTSGHIRFVSSEYMEPELRYIITVVVADQNGQNRYSTTISALGYTVDFLAGGTGVAFGKPAETSYMLDTPWGIRSVDNRSLTRISRNGVSSSWQKGRDAAMIKQHSLSGYSCMGSIKTASGTWDIGAYDVSGFVDRVIFTHVPDSSYNSNSGAVHHISFLPDGSVSADGNIKGSSLTSTGNVNIGDKLYVRGRNIHEQKLLWSGSYFMTSGHVVNLPSGVLVTDQPNGIVLVFSYYSNTSGPKNEQMTTFFVPKYQVASRPGVGVVFNLSNPWFNATKYLYIHNNQITGHDSNGTVKNVGGVTYENNRYVLREVIGV